MPDKTFKPLSLAQLFEAPDGFIGHFGWMCGYSADAGFLNDAAERFTRQTDRQRAFAGKIALAVMLDPGNPQISCADVPGILHLPIRTDRRPFNLLHAKIALLGFRNDTIRNQWCLRLIVSTGNWTRETLEESLDLAWTIETSSQEVARSLNPEAKQRCADFKVAWSLLDWLRGHFDCRALSAGAEGHQGSGRELEEWIGMVRRKSGLPLPRFFDSRNGALLAQLPEMIKATGVDVARNYLAMGSGFYEASDDGSDVPSVLADIVRQLQRTGLLTRAPEVDIFVNPNACQAVAVSITSIRERGWRVRKAGKPENLFGKADRALHAKFIFGANSRENSNVCNSAWIYFGSGNLTTPGFSQKISRNGGNLEAGVVFAPRDQLFWFSENNAEQYRVVTNVLPVQWDQEFDEAAGNLRAGGDMPEREEEFVAAPVAYLVWRAAGNALPGGWLIAPNEEVTSFEVVDANGAVCPRDGENGFRWPDEQPRQVRLCWQTGGQQQTALIPVLDQFGRLAGTNFGAVGIEEAWLQLASFPMSPDEDDLPGPDGDDQERAGIAPVPQQKMGTGSVNYPIRQMMQLIENIAVKQTAIEAADWIAWCIRLEQSLSAAADNEVLQGFQKFAINPLSPLWHPQFRPEFAEASHNAEGARYEAVLTRLEEAWKVGDLERLEG